MTDSISRRRNAAHLAALATLALLLAAVYGRVGGFDFAFVDDIGYIALTGPVKRGLTFDGVVFAFTSFQMGNWHPLTWLSYMLDIELFGYSVAALHLVNVVLHGLNSALLYAICCVVFRRIDIALLLSAIFLAHPLHVESVAWIAERKDLLCGLFYLGAVLAHLSYGRVPSPARYLGVLLLCVLALLSKPMAVSLPLVLLLLDAWPLNRFARPQAGWYALLQLPGNRRLLLEKVPLAALAAVCCVLTVIAQQESIASLTGVPPVYRVLNAAASYWHYLGDMLLPVGLAFLYPLRPVDVVREILPAVATLGGITVLCVLARRRIPALLVGWAWFLVTLLPVIGIVQVGLQQRADRYMYLPSVGLLLALGAVLAVSGQAVYRRAMAGLVAWTGFLCVMAWIQVGYWANDFMVFSRVLDVSGPNPQAYASLSTYYQRYKKLDEAERHALLAVSLDPDNPAVLAQLGNVLLDRKEYANAEHVLRQALALRPRDAGLLNNLGVALEKQGKREEALRAFRSARQNDPSLDFVDGNLDRLSR